MRQTQLICINAAWILVLLVSRSYRSVQTSYVHSFTAQQQITLACNISGPQLLSSLRSSNEIHWSRFWYCKPAVMVTMIGFLVSLRGERERLWWYRITYRQQSPYRCPITVYIDRRVTYFYNFIRSLREQLESPFSRKLYQSKRHGYQEFSMISTPGHVIARYLTMQTLEH